MFAALLPALLDGSAATSASYLAASMPRVPTPKAPIWDIGANIKAQGIPFAVYLLMGGSAIIAGWQFFFNQDKTHALKTVAVGVLLIGLVASISALGGVSKDTIGTITSGSFR